MTPPKKDLKTRYYSKDLNMDNNVATLPKKGLKTRHYNIGMEKSDLKEHDHTTHMEKLTKGQLLKQGAGTPEKDHQNPLGHHLYLQVTISSSTMTYSKPKTQVLESSK